MNRIRDLIILILLMAAVAFNACGQEWDTDGQLIRLTPAIPGGEPFEQQVELPQTPEPGSLMVVALGAMLLLARNHAPD